MTTLLAVYNSSGCVGRCDAKCYEAEELKCDCVCHGRNHGAGLKQAVDNTRALAETWIEQYNQDHHLDGVTWEIPAKSPVQLSLL